MKRLATVLLSLVGAAAISASLSYDAELAQILSYYSAAAYCNASSIESWTCSHCHNITGVTQATVVEATAYGSSLQAYVALVSGGGVVLSYRGTLSNGDVVNWFVDIAFRLQNISAAGCEGCALHEGFLAGYHALNPGVNAALATFGALHAPFVHVTGHSLGAGMAEIAAFNLLASGKHCMGIARHFPPPDDAPSAATPPPCCS